MKRFSSPLFTRAAFSLIEMLVAIAVLALMTVLLAQMFSSINQVWLGGQARVDNFAKARALLDIISEDLKQGIYRPDLAAFPTPGSFTFYTRRTGARFGVSGLRPVSLVRYLQTNTTLQRGDMAVAWSDPADCVSFGITNQFPHSNGITMRDISSGVIGFRILFLGTNGRITSAYDRANGLKGFAVGLAVVDGGTLGKLSPSQIGGLRDGLAAVVTGTNSIRADWDGYLATGIDWSSYPRSLASGFRFFERYVSVP